MMLPDNCGVGDAARSKMSQADEAQALLRHHASAIIKAIDNGGLEERHMCALDLTCRRMVDLTMEMVELFRE